MFLSGVWVVKWFRFLTGVWVVRVVYVLNLESGWSEWFMFLIGVWVVRVV